ncbi:hypothetical protein EON67_10160, partial [archaeon]
MCAYACVRVCACRAYGSLTADVGQLATLAAHCMRCILDQLDGGTGSSASSVDKDMVGSHPCRREFCFRRRVSCDRKPQMSAAAHSCDSDAVSVF